MTSPEFVQTKLENRTTAATSEKEAKNNRWHYLLVFDENIGWDWLDTQVEKVSNEVDPTVEPYKIKPSKWDATVVEVREVERRSSIDTNQHSLQSFES